MKNPPEENDGETGNHSAGEGGSCKQRCCERLPYPSYRRAYGLRDRSTSGGPERLHSGDGEKHRGKSLRAYFFITFVGDDVTVVESGGAAVVVVVVVIGAAPGAVRGGGVWAGAKPIGRL